MVRNDYSHLGILDSEAIDNGWPEKPGKIYPSIPGVRTSANIQRDESYMEGTRLGEDRLPIAPISEFAMDLADRFMRDETPITGAVARGRLSQLRNASYFVPKHGTGDQDSIGAYNQSLMDIFNHRAKIQEEIYRPLD